MKNHFSIWIAVALVFINVGFLYGASGVIGQQSPVQSINVPAPTPYAITVQDGNSRVWERTVYELDPSGQVVPKKHSYTELATGLNHLINGRWVASNEEIEIQPNGTASATQGQHQAYFPGDIYSGQIELVTPDGVQMHSRPMGLSYFDGTNIVLIAELTNSIGQVLGTNQVIYPNAFTDFKADLIYTYKKGGFEQDIVLRERPPAPESFGLDPQNTRLQVLTEFFDTADPAQAASAVNPQSGLSDTTLAFGQMQMVRGKAFSIGDASQTTSRTRGIPVYKSWVHLNGRTFLIEELPLQQIETKLKQLPLPANVNSTVSSANSVRHKVSTTRLLTPFRLVQANTNTMQLAKVELNRKSGLVLDYVTVVSGQTDFTFQGDTTYYFSSDTSLYGTTTIEGGTVIKADINIYAITIEANGAIACKTAPYRPGVFTDKDDNSVGETISGSSGSPSANSVSEFFDVSNTTNTSLHDLRFSYYNLAVDQESATTWLNVTNCQFTEGDVAVSGWNVGLQNVLISRTWPGAGSSDSAIYLYGPSLVAENVTADGGYAFVEVDDSVATVALTNCLITGQPLLASFAYTVTPLINSTVLIQSPSTPIYQMVGGGNYYLTNNSPYRNYGTTNINQTLLAELSQKTTYPPIVYSNTTIPVATNFSPQAWRDTNAAPDLGYHYDPLDYIFTDTTANSNITFTAGTAAGWFRTSWGDGIHLGDDVTAAFNGTSTSPDYWVRINTVQEQDRNGIYGTGGMTGSTYPSLADAPIARLSFTRCSMMSYDGNHFRDNFGYLKLNAVNSEFWGGGLGGYILLANFTNCLLDRCSFELQGDDNGSRTLTMQNDLMHGTILYLSHWSNATWPVSIIDSAFDGTTISVDTNSLTCDYNAFLTNNTRLPVFGTHDLTNVISYNWQSSWFGNFYQPTNSPLINMGGTTAGQVGLFNYTTQTNQLEEGSSIVDIGYHYVALDVNGNILDNDADGVPDWEDADPNNPGAGILTVFIDSPTNGMVLQ